MKTNWIREHREKLNLSQEEVSAKLRFAGLDISRATVSHWENDRHNVPLEDSALRHALANILKMTIPEILMAAGFEISDETQSDAAKRAAFIIEQLSPAQQELALRILEQFLE